jgi:hypothetical protein
MWEGGGVMARIPLIACALVLAAFSISLAQWSSDPAVNLSVADGTGDQVQAKVAPTPDGGCYISWFDALANGFDVRIQKLDSGGNEVFPHNGVLVADRSFSWTQDYGLDVDSSGNALLVFRDDRWTGEQITAAKVSPTGMLLWGPSGVQLTNTTGYVAAPKIAGTGDGAAVVAWTEDSDVRLQRLAADGSPVWASDVVLTPTVGTYSASDMHDAGTDVILSIVHVTGAYYAPKHLKAQKLDSMGSLLWGTDPVAVFDGGSLQFGNYPEFVPDGSGGAVFSWYDTASLQLQCYAQRILADGTEAFPHNGTAVSTNSTRIRVSPSAALDGAANETFVFWEEQDSSQSQSGVYGQKLDASGVRQWGSDGILVVPVGSDQNTQIRCVTEASGAFVFWVQSGGLGLDTLYGARLDGAGTIDIPRFDVASALNDKSKLAIGRSTAGFTVLAWQDDRVDAGDVFAQNVNADGSLGTPWVGVGGDELAGHAAFLSAPWPNPTGGTTQIMCSAPGRQGNRLEVYDVSGRLIRTLSAGSDDRLETWDGCDAGGRRVPGGVYFLLLRGATTTDVTKVTVIR